MPPEIRAWESTAPGPVGHLSPAGSWHSPSRGQRRGAGAPRGLGTDGWALDSSLRRPPGRPTHPVPWVGPGRAAPPTCSLAPPRPCRRALRGASPPRLLPIGPHPPPAPSLTGATTNRKSQASARNGGCGAAEE